ncbi:MAG: hypothetical protein J5595_05840 [Bacteroidales bacterium]|nr:hypothetical protein [Bacteroidales bacterium]
MKKILILIITIIMAKASMAQQDKPVDIILKAILETYDFPFTQEDAENARMNDGMNCRFSSDGIGVTANCLPHKNGGYMVLLFVEDMSEMQMNTYVFYYNDGEISNPTNVLPYPTMDDYYSNAAQFPKDAYDAIAEVAKYAVYTYDTDTKQLQISFLLFYSDDEIIKKYMAARKSLSGPKILYAWDGEKFVRTPDSKPFDEDLSIFGVEGYVPKNPESIAMEAFKAYFATDPFEIGLSKQEYLDKYEKYLIKKSPTVAETMGIYLEDKNAARKLKIACYEFKKGGYLVIVNEVVNEKFETFSFKDGKLTPLPNAFPQIDPEKTTIISPSEISLEGYFIDHFAYDGFEIHGINISMNPETMEMNADEDDVTYFKWDGEKFVK